MRIYRVDGVARTRGRRVLDIDKQPPPHFLSVDGPGWLEQGGLGWRRAAGTRRSGRFLLAYISETPTSWFVSGSVWIPPLICPLSAPGVDSASAVDTRRTEGRGRGGWFILSTGSCPPRAGKGSFRYQVLLFHTLEQGFLDARQGWKRGDWDGMGKSGGRLVGEATRRSTPWCGDGAVGCFALVGFYIEN